MARLWSSTLVRRRWTACIRRQTQLLDKADIELTTEWIMVQGELEIGTEAKPHTRKATITLTDNVPGEELDGWATAGSWSRAEP